jgi:hypothetical protein
MDPEKKAREEAARVAQVRSQPRIVVERGTGGGPGARVVEDNLQRGVIIVNPPRRGR